jgi:hypothetical protein
MKALAIALGLAAALLILAAVWWNALLGMTRPVMDAAFVTVFVLFAGCGFATLAWAEGES